MKLPYAEEITALRARVDAGQEAMKLNQLVKSALTAISVVEVQYGQGMPVPHEIPGEEVVDTAAALLPQLAELHSVGRGATDYATRLASRRQQLMLAGENLQPVIDEIEGIAAELHTLQHKQHHELEKPEWSEAVAELKRLSHARDQLALQMAPLRTQIAHIGPMREMLLAFHPQLQEELVAAARTEDPDGRIAWRAGMMSQQMLVGLADVVNTLGLAIAFPVEPMLPDAPHPRHRRRLRKEAGAVLEWMVQLSQALGRHGDVLDERLAGLELELDKYEAALKERMG
jgi:hypothetical protein